MTMDNDSETDAYAVLKRRLQDDPMVMGILNVTPDSFSDGGRYAGRSEALRHAMQLQDEGADIIDVGGESSRPGAAPVPVRTELERVIPVIEAIREKSDILLSVDTCKAEVARAALEAGADWINDISALRFDPEMTAVVQAFQCPVVIMHMQGEPRTMQENPFYKDVVGEVKAFFSQRTADLAGQGITRLIIDPGIGFGKRLEDNLQLLRQLEELCAFGIPVLIGVSRKSFIGHITGRPAGEREAGTLAANLWGYQKGARILRTHAVGPLQDALKMIKSIAGNVNPK